MSTIKNNRQLYNNNPARRDMLFTRSVSVSNLNGNLQFRFYFELCSKQNAVRQQKSESRSREISETRPLYKAAGMRPFACQTYKLITNNKIIPQCLSVLCCTVGTARRTSWRNYGPTPIHVASGCCRPVNHGGPCIIQGRNLSQGNKRELYAGNYETFCDQFYEALLTCTTILQIH